jgi:hypothetical protein
MVSVLVLFLIHDYGRYSSNNNNMDDDNDDDEPSLT